MHLQSSETLVMDVFSKQSGVFFLFKLLSIHFAFLMSFQQISSFIPSFS